MIFITIFIINVQKFIKMLIKKHLLYLSLLKRMFRKKDAYYYHLDILNLIRITLYAFN